MATKRTTFITTSNGGGGGTLGAIILGGLALSAGMLAIDHHYSTPGTSAFDKLSAKLKLGHGTPPAGPPGPPHKVGAAPLPQRLPPYVQSVIDKAIATETDHSVLSTLAS